MRRRVVLLFLTAAIGVAFIAYLRPVSRDTTVSKQKVIDEQTAVSQDTLIATPQTSHAPPEKVAVPQRTLQKKFGTSASLQEFVNEHAESASRGDGEAARLIADAYEECKQLTADPAQHAQMLKSILAVTMTAERARLFDAAMAGESSRCAGLLPESLTGKKTSVWLRGAAANGDLSARIQILDANLDQRSFGSLTQDVGTARDGAAMVEIGNLLGQLPAEERTALGGLSAMRLSAYAWQLAGCDFGADCSAYGQSLRNICIRGALCGFNSLQDAYQELLSPLDLQEALIYRDKIESAMLNGQYEELAGKLSNH